jgi:hypothetical protein
MKRRMNRRSFAKAGAAATLGLTTLESAEVAGSEGAGSGKHAVPGIEFLDVRPYQLMCIVCRIGEGRSENLGDARLDEILAAAREDPARPIRLRLNHESVYRYQNPGSKEDTPEGELFNAKRDLDIIQKLGLVPGDARPAIDMFERLFADISNAKGICEYETVTSDTWGGCPRARSGNYEKGHALGVNAVIPGRDELEKKEFKKTSVEKIYQAKTLRIRPHHLMCMCCFFGGRMDDLAPIQEDNLFEAIDVIHKNPDIPVTLIRGTCMICPPCSHYDSKTTFCLGGRSVALRDQKKDLDVLQKLGLKYGDTLPARKLYDLLFERIPSTRDVCGYGDGKERAGEWSICRSPEGSEEYRKAREVKLGLKADDVKRT